MVVIDSLLKGFLNVMYIWFRDKYVLFMNIFFLWGEVNDDEMWSNFFDL